MMTLDEIRWRVDYIDSLANTDVEGAHGEQDLLFMDVLEAVANNDHIAGYASLLAEEALKVRAVKFPRYFA